MTAVGDRIRQERQRAVLTQQELAAAAGISRTALVQIEAGNHKPRPSTIRNLANALGVNPSAFVDGG